MKPTEGKPTAAPSLPNIDGSTLPFNFSISVLDSIYTNNSFKIVIRSQPSIINSNQGSQAFSNIILNGGNLGVGKVIYRDSSLRSYFGLTADADSFSNIVGLDPVKRSVSVLPDVNGDGNSDLIIGDPINDRCYVLFGTWRGLRNMTQGFTIFGESEGDLTGWSVSGAGDVNNDTLNDIIIGAPNARGAGAVYVIYGSRSMCDVSLDKLDPSEGGVYVGAFRNDYFGVSVSNAGDVNNDGCDDVIAGAISTVSYYAGAAYVIFGRRNLQSMTSMAHLDNFNGFKLSGVAYLYAGISVSAAGDVNCDGYDDVIVGSSPIGTSLSLSAFIIFGNSTMKHMTLTTMKASQGIRIVGGGSIVIAVGDVNDDKCSDVIVVSNVVNDGSSVILYTSINNLASQKSHPSVFPTLKPILTPSVGPTMKATRLPSTKPSMKPSIYPTITPTSPTRVPMTGSSDCPTVLLSFAPSDQPTQSPSEAPTIAPSAEPSESPVVEPSVDPTAIPTQPPSIVPSESPTTVVPTAIPTEGKSRVPVGIPTRLPTIALTLPLLIEFVVNSNFAKYNDSISSVPTHYSVNATGNVRIEPARAKCVYMIVPGSNLTLTIARFNVSNDVIDLHLFASIKSVSDLVITAGSVIITLPSSQVIHILDQEPSAMSEINFIFATSSSSSNVTSFIIGTIAISVPIAVIVLITIYLCRRYRMKTTKLDYSSALTQKFIGQFETDRVTGEYILGNMSDDEEESVTISYDSCVESNAGKEEKQLSVNLSDFTMGSLSKSNSPSNEEEFRMQIEEYPIVYQSFEHAYVNEMQYYQNEAHRQLEYMHNDNIDNNVLYNNCEDDGIGVLSYQYQNDFERMGSQTYEYEEMEQNFDTYDNPNETGDVSTDLEYGIYSQFSQNYDHNDHGW